MDLVDLMKCADLAAHLGHILEVNPVWKDGYVIFDDEPLAMAQKRRLESHGGGLHLKIIRYTADSEIVNWRI